MVLLAVGGAWYCHWDLVEMRARHAALLSPDFPLCGFGYIGPTLFARLFSALGCIGALLVPAVLEPTRGRVRGALLGAAIVLGYAGLTYGWPPSFGGGNGIYLGLSAVAALGLWALRRRAALSAALVPRRGRILPS